jgi:hypothetical protein
MSGVHRTSVNSVFEISAKIFFIGEFLLMIIFREGLIFVRGINGKSTEYGQEMCVWGIPPFFEGDSIQNLLNPPVVGT